MEATRGAPRPDCFRRRGWGPRDQETKRAARKARRDVELHPQVIVATFDVYQLETTQDIPIPSVQFAVGVRGEGRMFGLAVGRARLPIAKSAGWGFPDT